MTPRRLQHRGGTRFAGALVAAGSLALSGCDGDRHPPRGNTPAPVPPAATARPTPVPTGERPAALHGTWELDLKAGSARDLSAAEREALAGARLALRADGTLARVLAGDRQTGTWEARSEELVLRFAPVLNEPGAAGSEDVLRYGLEEGGRALRLREGDQEFLWRRQ